MELADIDDADADERSPAEQRLPCLGHGWGLGLRPGVESVCFCSERLNQGLWSIDCWLLVLIDIPLFSIPETLSPGWACLEVISGSWTRRLGGRFRARGFRVQGLQ